MDGVHAQAYHLLKTGFNYLFNTEEIVKVNLHNEQFSVRTTEDELVEKMIRPSTLDEISKGSSKWKSPTDIAISANFIFKYPMNRNSARYFGVALKRAGFQSKRLSSGIAYAVTELPEYEKAMNPQTPGTQAPPSEEPGAGVSGDTDQDSVGKGTEM
jgi:hypothetical protein